MNFGDYADKKFLEEGIQDIITSGSNIKLTEVKKEKVVLQKKPIKKKVVQPKQKVDEAVDLKAYDKMLDRLLDNGVKQPQEDKLFVQEVEDSDKKKIRDILVDDEQFIAEVTNKAQIYGTYGFGGGGIGDDVAIIIAKREAGNGAFDNTGTSMSATIIRDAIIEAYNNTTSAASADSDSWPSVSADYYTKLETYNKTEVDALTSADNDSWLSVSADYYTSAQFHDSSLDVKFNEMSATSASIGGTSGQTVIGEDGHLKFQGEAVVWDDLRFQFTSQQRGVIITDFKPDFDETNLGLLFPQNDPSEITYIIAQFSHTRKHGSPIRPHIHYIQSQSAQPNYAMDYRWYENGAQVPSFTTLHTSANDKGIFTYTSGDMLQIAEFPEIDGSAIDSVSSMMDIKIYRTDNDVSGDVLTKEFDIHYQLDGVGSNSQYTK